MNEPRILAERFVLASPQECYQALMEHMRAGCPGSRRYVFGGWGAETWKLQSGSTTFVSAADGSLENYLKGGTLKGEGWIVNGFQAWLPQISNRVNDWITKVVPAHQKAVVLVDAFFGRYMSSFFQLHKDEMDIYAFPILGAKTYLCWPYEKFQHLGGSPADACHPERQEPYDPNTAIKLVPQFGQVAYWPASYWHMAETDGEPSFSINIGVKYL